MSAKRGVAAVNRQILQELSRVRLSPIMRASDKLKVGRDKGETRGGAVGDEKLIGRGSLSTTCAFVTVGWGPCLLLHAGGGPGPSEHLYGDPTTWATDDEPPPLPGLQISTFYTHPTAYTRFVTGSSQGRHA